MNIVAAQSACGCRVQGAKVDLGVLQNTIWLLGWVVISPAQQLVRKNS
jgi:hypothetical protein